MVGDPHRRIEHISALASDIATQEHIAVKLLSTTVRAFYDFFMIACLTVGVVALVLGKQDKAALWGGMGLALALIWILAFVGTKVSKRAVRALKEELHKAPPGRQSTAGHSHPS
ncbi:hypothetical protein GCM10009838_17350 [Catenulispora subtropica]|uniref:Uncharacterized protein n=1 Tax=Catenulispora subtropica TaxID=450798 RepID=A0ABN2R136_9ACTN